jgi:hypothetical protein
MEIGVLSSPLRRAFYIFPIPWWSVITRVMTQEQMLSMDSNPTRNWSILNWNVRGLNSVDKCNAIRSKIEESSCSVYCI